MGAAACSCCGSPDISPGTMARRRQSVFQMVDMGKERMGIGGDRKNTGDNEELQKDIEVLDDSKYDGEWQGDKRHGSGTYTYGNGDVYEGEWFEGKASGVGVFKTKLAVYDGSWENDFKHGEMLETFKVEEEYEDNRKTKTRIVEVATYKGNYHEGHKIGIGLMTWIDESTYEGEWLGNEFHGHGIFTWPNSEKYTGQWYESHMDGQGAYEWPELNMWYDGHYRKGLKHGDGTVKWKDGREMKCIWKEGTPQGAANFKANGWIEPPSDWRRGVMVSWADRSHEPTPREDGAVVKKKPAKSH